MGGNGGGGALARGRCDWFGEREMVMMMMMFAHGTTFLAREQRGSGRWLRRGEQIALLAACDSVGGSRWRKVAAGRL